jgi:enoyl-[acyl-carrier protein] reductase II
VKIYREFESHIFRHTSVKCYGSTAVSKTAGEGSTPSTGAINRISMHKDFFGYEHPIICSSMNGVSDINLALACAKAGIVPSLTMAPITWYLDKLPSYLERFRDELGHCNLILGVIIPVRYEELEDYILRLVEKYEISHCEFIFLTDPDKHDSFVKKLHDLRCKVLRKQVVAFRERNEYDALITCGNESAGYSDTLSTKKLFVIQRTVTPDVPVIASGGISTRAQIKEYLDLGALAVSIGTLFAMSEESTIALPTKKVMIEKTSRDLSRMKLSGLQGIVRRDVEKDDDQDRPIDYRLKKGILGDLDDGVIFAGTGIDQINKILPVQEIVNRLVNDS